MYGTVLLFIIIVYSVVVLQIGLSSYKTHRRFIRAILTSLVVFALPIVFLLVDFLPGYIKFRSACSDQGGAHIYRTAAATGYLNESPRVACLGCWEDLIEGRYEYLEFHIRKSGRLTDLLYEPGYFRVYIEERPSPLCEAVDKKTEKYSEYYEEFFTGRCIAVEKIERPQSRFSYERDYETSNVFGFLGNSITHVSTFITERSSGELIAESHTYDYRAWQILIPAGQMDCPVTYTAIAEGLVRTVLTPNP